MRNGFRCNCPITSALDIVGDKWILVVVKQMLIEGKETFKEFSESEESIATNVLSSKLSLLVDVGVVNKSKRANNKKTIYYHLTEMGLSLAPIIVELFIWSDRFLRERHPSMQDLEGMEMPKFDSKESLIKGIVSNYRNTILAVQEG